MMLIVMEDNKLRTFHVFKNFESFKNHVLKHLTNNATVIIIKND